MISPFKFIVSKLPEIKIIVQDYPKFFNAKFQNVFKVNWISKLRLLIRQKTNQSFTIISNVIIRLGLSAKPNTKFDIIPKFKVRSLDKIKFKQEFNIIPNVTFQVKIRTFYRLITKQMFTIVTNIKSRLLLRVKTFNVPFTVKMSIKSIVAIFYKFYERDSFTIEQVCNNEQLNTVQKYLWREIK